MKRSTIRLVVIGLIVAAGMGSAIVACAASAQKSVSKGFDRPMVIDRVLERRVDDLQKRVEKLEKKIAELGKKGE